ncbi:MAG: 5-oxoprolinase subunit PxpB [Proteobacteria bacterium]|jgi:KipI family sensor histidine kinase inhibitor|nr:5-oxoprolinase subunit PxpB [Pseudomonadota bacterium]
MRIENAGENSVIGWFADHASVEVNESVMATCNNLEQSMGGAIIDLVPSYASLLVIFDPFRTHHAEVRERLSAAFERDSSSETITTVIELPVLYGEAFGPDLTRISENAGVTEAQVAELHQSIEYRVYAIGFAPGFAYLGEVDSRLATPRLETPRQNVPKGAVAIADRKTAVYPAQSPGGWNLIGLCPTRLIDPAAESPMLITVGDRVRFVEIDESQYLSLGGEL